MNVQISASSSADRPGPPVALEPAVHEGRHHGLVLEEAHRRAQVVQVPAEPGVVEVDDADRPVVDQQVGQPGIRVHQAVPVRPGAERPQPGAQRVIQPGQDLTLGRPDADAVLPPAPAGLLAERRRVIPVEPGEPGRPGPFSRVPVHPRGDLPQLDEVRAGQRGIVGRAARLGAGQELEPDAVPLRRSARLGYGDHPPSAGGRPHPRRAHPRLRAQGVHPGQLRGDLLLGVVAQPVHTEHGRPGVRVGDQEGRVLRDVEQLDGRRGADVVVGGQRVPRAAPDPVHDVAARRQVVLCHLGWPMATRPARRRPRAPRRSRPARAAPRRPARSGRSGRPRRSSTRRPA